MQERLGLSDNQKSALLKNYAEMQNASQQLQVERIKLREALMVSPKQEAAEICYKWHRLNVVVVYSRAMTLIIPLSVNPQV